MQATFTDFESADLLQPGLSGAFVREGFRSLPYVPQVSSDALAELRLAVKDVFSIQGMRTGGGNPQWLGEQAPSSHTAHAVGALLGAGAQWVGKTVTDELAYSLSGVNLHYGTPVNPASPDRLPGGSSSGSVVAVAGGHADIGLATDCGGSARLPASYCGVWGIRPSHGLLAGVSGFALAPGFDTVGWFARTGDIMQRVFDVLSADSSAPDGSYRWIISDDAGSVCDEPVKQAYEGLFRQLAEVGAVSRQPGGTMPLQAWCVAHRILQGAEIWAQHGEWVKLKGQALAPFIRDRFTSISRLNVRDVIAADRLRHACRTQLAALLGSDAILVVPTAPGVAPLLTAIDAELVHTRERSQQLLAMAGLAGLPQVSLPWITLQDAPVGLSVIGPRGADRYVLQAAIALEKQILCA